MLGLMTTGPSDLAFVNLWPHSMAAMTQSSSAPPPTWFYFLWSYVWGPPASDYKPGSPLSPKVTLPLSPACFLGSLCLVYQG